MPKSSPAEAIDRFVHGGDESDARPGTRRAKPRVDVRGKIRRRTDGVELKRVNAWITVQVADQLVEYCRRNRCDIGGVVEDALVLSFARPSAKPLRSR